MHERIDMQISRYVKSTKVKKKIEKRVEMRSKKIIARGKPADQEELTADSHRKDSAAVLVCH
jgi:hypothetical protein